MAQDTMVNLVEKNLKTLETMVSNNEAVTSKDIELLNNKYINLVKNSKKIDDAVKAKLENRINNLKSMVNEETVTLSTVSPKSFRLSKKAFAAITAATTLGVLAATTTITLHGCGEKQAIATEVNSESASENKIVINDMDKEVKQPNTGKVLPENLAFDPNDNAELVDRMVKFIADAVSKGVAVKDVMTDEEIKLAEDNDVMVLTIAQLMDFYMGANIEDIDPKDYARLAYTTKTAETITDNYMTCSRAFMTDNLTAKENDVIDYSRIYANKESGESVQRFINLIAGYNSGSVSVSEVTGYINDTYNEKDANRYSMSANYEVYRNMFVADMVTNNAISHDVNVILNEDGKINCDTEKEDGVKNKTEKAEEFTSMYNTVSEKLEISREYGEQDLSLVTEYERKTGIELEKDIKEKVLAMNISFKLSEKFKTVTGSVSAKGSGKGSTSYKTFKDANGKLVNVADSELLKYGVNPADPAAQTKYETAKKAEFDQKAKADPNHVIKDNKGNVVASGLEADATQYNAGYAAGYSDGNNKKSSNPGNSNKSYIGGYNAGYAQGLADRNALDSSLGNGSTTTYEPVSGGESTKKEETVVEIPYTGPINPTPAPQPAQQPEPTPEPQPEQPVGPGVTFEPIEGGSSTVEETIEEIPYTESTGAESYYEETIEEIPYTASLKGLLKEFKANLLYGNHTIVAEEENKTIKM